MRLGCRCVASPFCLPAPPFFLFGKVLFCPEEDRKKSFFEEKRFFGVGGEERERERGRESERGEKERGERGREGEEEAQVHSGGGKMPKENEPVPFYRNSAESPWRKLESQFREEDEEKKFRHVFGNGRLPTSRSDSPIRCASPSPRTPLAPIQRPTSRLADESRVVAKTLGKEVDVLERVNAVLRRELHRSKRELRATEQVLRGLAGLYASSEK